MIDHEYPPVERELHIATDHSGEIVCEATGFQSNNIAIVVVITPEGNVSVLNVAGWSSWMVGDAMTKVAAAWSDPLTERNVFRRIDDDA